MYTITQNHNRKIAVASLIQRESEVMQYQVNIDNYRSALHLIGQKPQVERDELAGFTQALLKLLDSEILEQKKAQVMLDVALVQLEGQDITALIQEAQNVSV